MSAETGDLITRRYGNFRGVDFRGEDVNLSRSPDSVNMWKDYREKESIRRRPGLWLFNDTIIPKGARVLGTYIYRPSGAVDNGKYLYVYYFVDGTGRLVCFKTDSLGMFVSAKTICELPDSGEAKFFTFGEKVYIIISAHYYWHTPGAAAAQRVDPYVPTTSIGRKPAGGGTIHQDVNMLTTLRKNTFLGDGTSKNYYTDGAIRNLVSVKVNGKAMTIGSDCAAFGDYVTFYKIPPAPLTDGQDNVEIEFDAAIDVNRHTKVFGGGSVAVFDNRVFIGGSYGAPNVLWHSSLNDPTYFSDLDYYQEGLDNARITGLVAGNNALWIFREPSSNNTTIFYHTPSIDPEYGTIYPSTHSSISAGCIGKAVNFNDDIVFFSNRGMEGISGDVTTEQVISHRSTLVDSKLLAESNYKGMMLAEWEGYLLVVLNNKIYLADSRARFTNSDHMEYEWFYWEFDFNILGAYENDGYLYLVGDNGCIYMVNTMIPAPEKDGGKYAVKGHWVTPKDRFNAPQKLKTTNKRGCVVEAIGDAIAVSVKVEDTDFEPIGRYEDVTDYFVCRIKRKKWKDIQLKFESEKSFSLETATLEAFVGGYIKR